MLSRVRHVTSVRSRIKIMIPLRFAHLKLLTAFIICLGVALSSSIPDIVYRSEITDYFRADNPRVKNFHRLEENFGAQQSLVVLLESDQLSFLSAQGLTTLYNIIDQLKQQNGVERIQSLLSTAVSNHQQDTQSLIRYIKAEGALTNSILGQLADNANSNGTLLSDNGHVASLHIYFSSAKEIDRLYPIINDILNTDFKVKHAGNVYMLGPVEIKHALHQALLHDSVYLMPFVLISGLGVLWYFVRSYWLVLSGALSIIVALWITAGIVGWLKLTINQTSALAFCIAFIIALADIIHLLMSFTHQPPSIPQRDAMMNALRNNFSSLLLTSVTTGIGFLSLNGSNSPVFATFGNIAAIGVASAFIAAVSITPVMAVLKNNSARRQEPDLFQNWVTALNRARQTMQGKHYARFYLLSIVVSAGIFLNHYHNDPLDYFESDANIIQATNLSENAFQTHHPITIELDSMAKDGIFSARFLNAINSFQNWLEAHPNVSHHNSYNSILTQLKRHLHENNLKWAAQPATSAEVADLWNLYQMSSPDNQQQTLGLDKQFRSAVISVGIPKLSSSQLMALEQEIVMWFNLHAPQITASVTGHALLFASIGKELTSNMFIGGLLSAMVISILIGVFLKNMKLGLLCLIPNLFPAGIVYGLWGASVGLIDIAAAGTLSISLGIVVDDTIHILKRYSAYRRSGLTPERCITLTFDQVGSALMLTTVILSLGMLVLTLSIFGPNQTTAILMACIIIVALLYDLIMLPHLLERCDRWLFPGVTINLSQTEHKKAAPECLQLP